jgi:hypothetical protein
MPIVLLPLQTRIWLPEVFVGDYAQDTIRSMVARLHPRHDVTATTDFPIMNSGLVPKRFKLIPDPKCPLAITLRIAEEDFGHGALSCVGNRSTATPQTATMPPPRRL